MNERVSEQHADGLALQPTRLSLVSSSFIMKCFPYTRMHVLLASRRKSERGLHSMRESGRLVSM